MQQDIQVMGDANATDVSLLQVKIVSSEPVQSFTDDDGTVITGTNLIVSKVKTTYINDLQRQSDDLASQIVDLQSQKDEIDALIPQVTTALTSESKSTGQPFTAPVSMGVSEIPLITK